MPSRGLARTTAPNTTVSPYCTVTAPSASLASEPVSMESVRPPISRETRMACMWIVFLQGLGEFDLEQRRMEERGQAENAEVGMRNAERIRSSFCVHRSAFLRVPSVFNPPHSG